MILFIKFTLNLNYIWLIYFCKFLSIATALALPRFIDLVNNLFRQFVIKFLNAVKHIILYI